MLPAQATDEGFEVSWIAQNQSYRGKLRLTTSMSRSELSRIDVATDASDLRPFALLPHALCRLNSQEDFATITLDQDEVRLVVPKWEFALIFQIDHVGFSD